YRDKNFKKMSRHKLNRKKSGRTDVRPLFLQRFIVAAVAVFFEKVCLYPPVVLDLDVRGEHHLCPQKFLHALARKGERLFERLPLLSDEDGLVVRLFADDVQIDVVNVSRLPLFEGVDEDGNAVR